MAHKNDYQIQKQLDKPQTWLASPSSVASRQSMQASLMLCSRCSFGSAERDETTSAETDEQLCIYVIESTTIFLCRRIVPSLPLPSEFPQ